MRKSTINWQTITDSENTSAWYMLLNEHTQGKAEDYLQDFETTSEKDKAIIQYACILSVGALKTKLSLTTGKDWLVWCNALVDARCYRHSLLVDNEQLVIDNIKALLARVEWSESTFADTFTLEELSQFALANCLPKQTNKAEYYTMFSEVASGVPYKTVFINRYIESTDGKKHLMTEQTIVDSAFGDFDKTMVEIALENNATDIGCDIINTAVSAMDYDVRNRYEICKQSTAIFKAVHGYIYQHKKHGEKSWTMKADSKGNMRKVYLSETMDAKLGTKGQRTITDSTFNEVEMMACYEALHKAIDNSKATAFRKGVYHVFANAIANGLYDETDILCDVLKCKPNNLKGYKMKFRQEMESAITDIIR